MIKDLLKFVPKLREERILREQVAAVYHNFVPGIFIFYTATLIIAVVLKATNPASYILYWLLASTIVSGLILLRVFLVKDKNQLFNSPNPKHEAHIQMLCIAGTGIIWALLPMFFLDSSNFSAMVIIISLSAGLCAGGLTMQSPILPVYTILIFTAMPGLTIGLFMLDNIVYTYMGFGAIAYTISMFFFARNIEKVFKESIETRFENLDLISQLKHSMHEIEQANESKSVFLASASHDLRQPLHAMGLFIESLGRSDLNDHQKRIITHIEAASDALRDMFNTLLDFSKLDAGVIKPNPKPFLVRNLLTKLEQELAVSADAKDLIYRTRETNAAAYADSALVEMVLRNLITNAIRYTDQGGVLVACRTRPDNTLDIEVWDTGIGIPLLEQKNIFREFHQLGNPERDRQKGFGLGLAIAKGLAETMGHELILKSKLGLGTMFRITLPIATRTIIENEPSKQSQCNFENKTVLIIDDDENVRLGMTEVLNMWQCHCHTAESADEALQIVSDHKINLLIVDYRLREGKTGGEAIEKIRAKIGNDIPAIIITGDTAADRIREARSYDAILLHKPLATSELQIAMQGLIGKN